MEKVKAYTDIVQSKKLAEILPLESADMCFNTHNKMPPLMTPYRRFKEFLDMEPTTDFLIPCWSLAALLDVIPKHIEDYNVLRIDISENDFAMWYDEISFGVNNDLPDTAAENPIDACYDLILKLHELNLL